MGNVLPWVMVARGSLYAENFNNVNTAIPMGSPAGITFNGVVGDTPGEETVGGLTISVDISGDYNGNMCAYLVAPNGAEVVLLNQPGATGSTPFGYAGVQFNGTYSTARGREFQRRGGKWDMDTLFCGPVARRGDE